ncbi:hypothetical protein [Flexivirga caeni]|uniref:Uncharacterized protein n=1 Tax=Flexivirga caeni TaxID=2294115 RepID=A0A3M9M5L5_9MICO|nr:hypothetical protein [Flexivirga caeni]RNI20861.1 hypothetical protein EFY87_13225 [Flexivirga caeni]
MLLPLTVVLIIVLSLLALYAGYLTLTGKSIDNPAFYLTCAAELAEIAQLVVGIARIDDGDAHMSKALFIAYLAGLVCVLPIAAFWGFAERGSRWGTGVLLVATLGLLVMVARLVQLWNGQ